MAGGASVGIMDITLRVTRVTLNTIHPLHRPFNNKISANRVMVNLAAMIGGLGMTLVGSGNINMAVGAIARAISGSQTDKATTSCNIVAAITSCGCRIRVSTAMNAGNHILVLVKMTGISTVNGGSHYLASVIISARMIQEVIVTMALTTVALIRRTISGRPGSRGITK